MLLKCVMRFSFISLLRIFEYSYISAVSVTASGTNWPAALLQADRAVPFNSLSLRGVFVN